MAVKLSPDEDGFGSSVLRLVEDRIPDGFVLAKGTKTAQTKIGTESSWDIQIIVRRKTAKEKKQEDLAKQLEKQTGNKN